MQRNLQYVESLRQFFYNFAPLPARATQREGERVAGRQREREEREAGAFPYLRPPSPPLPPLFLSLSLSLPPVSHLLPLVNGTFCEIETRERRKCRLTVLDQEAHRLQSNSSERER